jgi:hypothetical protein
LRIRVRDFASPLTTDIDPDAHVDVQEIDGLVNRCINAVTESLKCPSTKFAEQQRQHLSQVFFAMRHAHRAIRELLRSEGKDPMAVSVMPVVRSQLETLFALCLIVEKPEWLAVYLKDGWKKLYVRHLWMREECKSLPRVAVGLQRVDPELEQFRVAWGVTEREKQTIDEDELGTPLPSGVQPEVIRQFPTPTSVIGHVEDPQRRSMLMRLYPEYQFLCGFVHFSPATMVLSHLLDTRGPSVQLFTSGQRYEMFQKELAGPAIWIDSISIVQSCSEFVCVYRSDVELARATAEAWKSIVGQSLIGRVVWQLRARGLLGALA